MSFSVNIVVAHEERFGIGKRGGLPWHLPKELKHFRVITMGGVVIMGYNTWASIPVTERPLKGRKNLVITRNPAHVKIIEQIPEVTTLDNPMHALKLALEAQHNIYIIGGAQIYRYYLEQGLIDRIYATVIQGKWDVDTYIPNYTSNFTLIDKSQPSYEEIIKNGETDRVSYQHQVWQKQ